MNAVQQGRSLKKLMGSLATILGGMGAMQVADAAIWSDTSLAGATVLNLQNLIKMMPQAIELILPSRFLISPMPVVINMAPTFLMSIYFSQMMSPTVPSQVVKVPKKPMW